MNAAVCLSTQSSSDLRLVERAKWGSTTQYFCHQMPRCISVLSVQVFLQLNAFLYVYNVRHFFCHQIFICIYLRPVWASAFATISLILYPILLSEKMFLIRLTYAELNGMLYSLSFGKT